MDLQGVYAEARCRDTIPIPRLPPALPDTRRHDVANQTERRPGSQETVATIPTKLPLDTYTEPQKGHARRPHAHTIASVAS